MSNPGAKAAASPRSKDTKDVSTQAIGTGTQELSDAPPRVLCIENIQAKLSSIEQAARNTIATKAGEEDQKGLPGKGVEQTEPNLAIPHPEPPRHLTELDKDQKAIDAYFSNCNIDDCHQGDAGGLVAAYLEARDDGALDEDQLAILAIRVSKMLQREERGDTWATVIKSWLGDWKSQRGAVKDEVLDKCVVDAVRNMLDDKERLRAIRVSEKSSGRFEEALRGYGDQMRKSKGQKWLK
ncbi:MAG: hypothetical protein Q9192_008814 [Flavoplaca navasiana]